MAISFMVVGIIVILFIHRIAMWLNRASLLIFRVAPWLNFSGKYEDRFLDEWSKSRLHIFETIWVWFLRIAGIILTLGGALILYALISQS